MVNDPYLTDEVARYRGLADRISSGRPVRPEHTEAAEVPAETGLSSADIDGAKAELSAERHESPAEIDAQLLGLAGGQTDDAAMTGAIVALAEMPRDQTCWLVVLSQTSPDEVDNGTIEHAVSELARQRSETYERCYDQVRALAGGERTRVALRTAVLDLAAMRPTETVSLSELTTAQKFALARTGVALSGGAFPIPDVGHLRAAVARYKEGALAGHSRAEVRAHIMKHAHRLGADVDLGDGTRSRARGKVAASGALALSQPALSDRTRMTLYKLGALAPEGEVGNELIRLAETAPPAGTGAGYLGLTGSRPDEASDDDDEETDAARKIREFIHRHSNSDLFQQEPRDRVRGDIHVQSDDALETGAEHPGKSRGKPITTATRAHSTAGFGGADSIVSRNPDILCDTPKSGNRVTPPKGLSRRQDEEDRALSHGRRQNRLKH